jgi:uncharacterized Zn finger protein
VPERLQVIAAARRRPKIGSFGVAMSIPREAEAQFERSCKEKGHRYFLDGRVTINSIERNAITARVQGTRAYTVHLYLDPGDIDFDCNCPYDWNWPCKHIWATLLQADTDGLLQ